MEEQDQQQGTREECDFLHSTTFHSMIWIVMILITLYVFDRLAYGTTAWGLQTYDAILLGMTWLAFAIAVICSHSYNYRPRSPEGSLQDTAAQKQATWLHANFSWRAVSVWMTITQLYCTCATIYISGSAGSDVGKGEIDHIIVYSILSLVISLGIYIICPSNRATGYREAYLIITTALSVPESDLASAIIEGEKVIAKQDTMNPS